MEPDRKPREHRPDRLQIISMTMQEGEELIVGRRLREILSSASKKVKSMKRLTLLLRFCPCCRPRRGRSFPRGRPRPGALFSRRHRGRLSIRFGQGAKPPDGKMPATFEAQAQQTLDNVKAVVEAAGLTLDHVVYTHVYLKTWTTARRSTWCTRAISQRIRRRAG